MPGSSYKNDPAVSRGGALGRGGLGGAQDPTGLGLAKGGACGGRRAHPGNGAGPAGEAPTGFRASDRPDHSPRRSLWLRARAECPSLRQPGLRAGAGGGSGTVPRAVLPATQAWSPEGGRTASTGRLLPRACDADPGGPAFLRPDRVQSPGGLQELAVDSEETVRGSAPPLSPPLSPSPCRAAGPPDRVSKRLGSEAGDGEGAPGLWERTWLTAALPAGHPRAGWRSHGPGRDPRRLGPLRTAWHGWPSRPRFSSESAGC